MIISVIPPVDIATLRDISFKGQAEMLLWHFYIILQD